MTPQKQKPKKKTDNYSIQTFVVWMANNRAKMTSLDHREVFRILNRTNHSITAEANGGVNEAS